MSPRFSCARRIRSSLESSPSTLRSSRPDASSSSIVRTCAGSAVAPPASAIERASVCRRLSSSTISATSSVIRASKLLRFSNDRPPSRISRLSGILMFTSLSEQSTPALLSMKSVLMRPPRSANSMRPACVIARLAPSPMTLARSSAASARRDVVRRIADVGLALVRGLDIGPDATEPEKVDWRLEDRVDERRGVGLFRLEAQSLASFGAQGNRFLGSRENAAALRDQLAIVIVPAGARQLEHPLALRPARRRIGIGVDEDVPMVECGDQLQRLR